MDARKAGALFVMNDRPDLAYLAEADGVHLGQDDLEIRHVKQIAGPDMLVGVSAHTFEQLERAIERGADYCGVGPTFPSQTKRSSANSPASSSSRRRSS